MSYGGVYSYSEQIYRAAELTAAGVPAGAVITTIAFYNATGATTMSDLRTYMGHRSMMNYSSTTDWTPFSTLVQVDSGDWVTTGVGWFDIQLDNIYLIQCLYGDVHPQKLGCLSDADHPTLVDRLCQHGCDGREGV